MPDNRCFKRKWINYETILETFCSHDRYSCNMGWRNRITIILAVIFQLCVVSCIRDNEPCNECEKKETVDVVIADLLPDALAAFEDLNMRTASLVFILCPESLRFQKLCQVKTVRLVCLATLTLC